MNKLIISAAALVCAAQAFAFVEKTEQMTVVKADGTTVVFDVADLDQVTFDEVETDYAYYVAPATGSALKLTAVPTVFRMSPAEVGNPYVFGISSVAAETPADARQGEYAIELAVGSSVMNTSGVDLSDKSNVVVTLYHYTDGKVDNVWEAQTSGTLTTAVNSKTQVVTLNLEADFEDGTFVSVSFNGKVTNVDDLVGLNPPFEYINQGQYLNQDGNPQGLFDVESLTYTANQRYHGNSYDHKFTFNLSNGRECFIYVTNDLVNAGEIDVDTLDANKFEFRYENIQVASKGTQYANGAKEGKINIVKNDDGSYKIDITMTNKYYYTSYFGETSVMGDPQYVIINFTGTPE